MQNLISQATDRYNELLALMEGDRELLQELIDVFLEDAPLRIDGVRHALAICDAGELYKAAHTLKGSAGNFGAPEVVSRATRLEALAREGDLAAAAIQFTSLEVEMDRLVGDLVIARNLS